MDLFAIILLVICVAAIGSAYVLDYWSEQPDAPRWLLSNPQAPRRLMSIGALTFVLLMYLALIGGAYRAVVPGATLCEGIHFGMQSMLALGFGYNLTPPKTDEFMVVANVAMLFGRVFLLVGFGLFASIGIEIGRQVTDATRPPPPPPPPNIGT